MDIVADVATGYAKAGYSTIVEGILIPGGVLRVSSGPPSSGRVSE
jgi:hypothetical protein